MKTKTKKRRYFHCSPNRLKVGTILQPGGIIRKRNFEYSTTDFKFKVFVTDQPFAHGTIAGKIDKWFMYEVIPIGKVERGLYGNEFVCNQAEIKRFIGNVSEMGKGIAKTFIDGKKYHVLPLRQKLNNIKNKF